MVDVFVYAFADLWGFVSVFVWLHSCVFL